VGAPFDGDRDQAIETRTEAAFESVDAAAESTLEAVDPVTDAVDSVVHATMQHMNCSLDAVEPGPVINQDPFNVAHVALEPAKPLHVSLDSVIIRDIGQQGRQLRSSLTRAMVPLFTIALGCSQPATANTVQAADANALRPLKRSLPAVSAGTSNSRLGFADARLQFFTYLNGIHNRLHPIFSDNFLASLGSLPPAHPMNRDDLTTAVELILEPADGKIFEVRITRSSGVPAFDIGGVESFKRAAPFGTAPQEIVSHDGKVHVHWELHRGLMACSTLHARLLLDPANVPP
jgi:hypothetical protein